MGVKRVSKARVTQSSKKTNVWDTSTTITVSPPTVIATSGQPRNATLQAANIFSSTDGSGLQSIDWQVATDTAFTNIVYESLNNTSSLTNITLPTNALAANTMYYYRARHTGANGRTSAWGNPSWLYTKGSTPVYVGDSFEGGYFAGIIAINSVEYYLIVSPKASGETTKEWKTTQTTTTGTTSVNDGLTNSNNMNDASHPAAQFCRGLSIGGYSDWYLPAKDELELCYRNLKPTTTSNDTSSGANSNSSPTGYNYTSSVPAQTSVTAFKTGDTEAFAGNIYWSSTESSSSNAWSQSFSNGGLIYGVKTSSFYVRAVRKVQVL